MSRRKIEREAPGQGSVIDMKTGDPVGQPPLPLVCERIRFYRKSQGMEQKAFAEKIGARANAVSNWEQGRSRPDISLLPKICDALGISLQQLFGQPAPGSMLSDRERKLVSGYRQLNSGDRFTVDTLVETMCTVDQARKRARARKKVHELPLIHRSLAAGVGDPSEYEGHAEPFYLYDVPWLDRADCVFKVNGDSMQPAYHSGDYVLVQRIPDAPMLQPGEIGAFSIGNELYIKEYQPDGLHSLNPEYPVIPLQEDTDIYLIGRVLGIVEEKDRASAEDIRLYQALHD